MPVLAQNIPAINVKGPTIVAFFPPVTASELHRSPDTNESLSDFQFYAQQVKEPLAKRGIAFQEVYARRMVFRIGKSAIQFNPKTAEVGYYYIAPGRIPEVYYGVDTDAGILQRAEQYFGELRK